MEIDDQDRHKSVSDVGTWWIYAVIGLLFIVYGLYAFTLSNLQPSHWDDITTSEDTVKYIADNFRWIGILSTALGGITIVVAYGGFKRGERWAWFAFWAYPLFFLFAIFFTWPGLLWSPLMIASILGLLRPLKVMRRAPPV